MKRLIITLILLFQAMSLVFGGNERYINYMAPDAVSGLGSMEVLDSKYESMLVPSWTGDFYNAAVKNRIWVGFDKNMPQVFTGTVSVQVQIDYWTYSGGVFVQAPPVTKTLTLSNNADGTQTVTDMASYVFSGAHRMVVTVLNVSNPSITNIYVKGSIDVERYYSMDENISGVNRRILYENNTHSQLELYWDEEEGAEYYDLEWTYVSNQDYDIDAGESAEVAASALNFDFYQNATRLRIREAYYRLPFVFNKGYIVYRVRAVGRGGAVYDWEQTGRWSLSETGVVSSLLPNEYFKVDDTKVFESGRNWVHSVGYTEDGRRFDNIVFIDGVGFARQSLTANPETNQLIISNQYYDRIGRAAVADLPTPVDQSVFEYFEDFNHGVDQYNVTAPYSFQHYDYVTEASPCLNPSYRFSENFGAGKYYSQNNPDKEGANVNIPDADGYAFSQVEYMNDQTGRIRRVGAYGSEHQLDKHATRIYYDVPLQSELNPLFGTQVGLNEHYQRRVTIDANGQAYIEYVDLAGRVVASCMAGDNPANLDRLDNNPIGLNEHIDIIYQSAAEQQINTDLGIAEINYVKTVVSPGTYTLSHALVPVSYTSECLPANFCYDCSYKLELKVTSIDCPNEPALYDETITVNGFEINEICNTTDYQGLTAELELLTGQYMISKKLSVDRQKAEDYWCHYVENLLPACDVNYHQLYNELYANQDLGCNPEEENNNNEPVDGCASKRALLRADMAPYGQYGAIVRGIDGDDLSIYNIDNSLPNPNGDWKNPATPYTNSDGTPAKIYLYTLNGVTLPAVDSPSNILSDAQGQYILPEHLANLSDFLVYYDPFWADALVEYHPEYCYLKFCEESNLYHSYTQQIKDIDGFDEACTIGLLSFADNFYVNSSDAFFFTQEWQTKENWFSFYNIPSVVERMDAYKTLPQPFYGKTTLNIFEYSIFLSGVDIGGFPSQGCNSSVFDNCNKDLIWDIFKNELLHVREEYYLLAQTAYVSYPANIPVGSDCSPSFNGCIGAGSGVNVDLLYGINPSKYKTFALDNTGTPVTQTGACASSTDDLYSKKTPRFNNLPSEESITENPFYGVASAQDAQTIFDQQVLTNCQTTCDSYAGEWMETLTGCVNLEDHYNEIKAALIAVCKKGCDANNPGGASTVNLDDPDNFEDPDNPATFESFEDVLEFYLEANYQTAECSALLISSPRPYGQNLTQVSVSNLDACGCDKIKKAEADFALYSQNNNLPFGVSSLETMLAYNEGVSLENANQLLCKCNAVLNGDEWEVGYNWSQAQTDAFAQSPFQVPAALSCNVAPCQNCSAIQDAVDDFNELFSDETNFINHPNYEDLYTNYLNNRLGFHLEFEAYESFLEQCSANNNSPSCYTTPYGRVFTDLVDVITRQGFLTSVYSQPYAMASQNIVYTNSSFRNYLSGSLYWTNYVPNATSLTLSFGSDANNAKEVFLELPDTPDFGFDDILGISSVQAIQGCDEKKFTLKVLISVCGVLQERSITGSSLDLELTKCFCNGTSELLCDKLEIEIDEQACYKEKLLIINSLSESSYQQKLLDKKEAFIDAYTARCTEAFNSESLTLTGHENYYQYTLYYYDQAGNLAKTIAPKGVFSDQNFPNTLANVDSDRTLKHPNAPSQEYASNYKYNSYNQVVSTTNPDHIVGGNQVATNFYYDYYGRLVASQNPEQAIQNTYSYSLFDAQGRPYEVGLAKVPQALVTDFMTAIGRDDIGQSVKAFLYSAQIDRVEVTYTIYDRSLSAAIALKFKAAVQQNLRLRISSVLYFDAINSNTDITTQYKTATHYSYDAHGNVIEELQDVPLLINVKQNIKSTQYEFELISGNVTAVKYQEGKADQMTHRYEYDRVERLRKVYTSSDGVHYTQEAHYHYFDYGPLARVEIGDHQVQAQDFAFTINGWLKGANATTLNRKRDTGKDGALGYYSYNQTQHKAFAKDITAFSLGYFNGDYKSIGNTTFEAQVSGAMFSAISPLYNGNIAHTTTSIVDFEDIASVYRYDQLNRLKSTRIFKSSNLKNTNSWSSASETNDYANSYVYDENGNFKNLNRKSVAGASMDNLTYQYTAHSNRLDYVNDPYDAANVDDIEPNQGTGNYEYDALGQLTKDHQENITYTWRLSDKKLNNIGRISNDNAPLVEFVYNPFGQRILKIIKERTNGVVEAANLWEYIYYALDANGQVIALYSIKDISSQGAAYLNEQHIYGSSRIGIRDKEIKLYQGIEIPYNPGTDYKLVMGEKRYELVNHLGNVNAVINDRKMQLDEHLDIINFDEVAAQINPSPVVYPMNSFSNNFQSTVAIVEPTPGNKAIQVTNVSGYGATNLTINQVIGQQYTLEFDMLSATASSASIVAFDANSNVLLFQNITAAGHYNFNYLATTTTTRLKFQIDNVAGNFVLDNIAVSGAGMEPQYPMSSIYVAVPLMKMDYYPFGMEMPGRTWQVDSYRYAYNGMEKDQEVKGDGNSYTTEFRQYDPRLGRWLSLDPLMQMFPWMSPYCAFDNNPIYYIDPYGLSSGNGNGEMLGNGNGEGNPPADGTIAEMNGKSYMYSSSSNSWVRLLEEVHFRGTKLTPEEQLSKEQITTPKDNIPMLQTFEQQERERIMREEAAKSSFKPRKSEMYVPRTEQQRLAIENWNRYGDYVAPKELIDKLMNGEEVDASEWVIEGISILPGGKLFGKAGKIFLKQGGKTIKVSSKKAIKKFACFTKGTEIAIEDGTKPIETIQVGDSVWAFDENSGDITLKKVTNTVVREIDHLEKLIIGSDTLYTTADHPFWVKNTWKPAGKIIVGDTLTFRNGEKCILNQRQTIDTLVTVYNFAVEDYHTYFVGKQNILVHNNNPCAQMAKSALEKAKEAVRGISSHRMGHIMQKHHNWKKISANISESDIKSIIEETLTKGMNVPYKGVKSKVMQYKGFSIQVTYKEINGKIAISDAWVINRQ